MKILLPYGVAILAQLPMLLLYFKGLWAQEHYQFFPFAVLATIGLAWTRWPRGSAMPFHRSLASDILMVLGFLSALIGVALVDPWYAALSIILIVTSLLARTQDLETGKSLWTCALPLFVCLYLPNRYDTVIITRLQSYSAQFTSKLLDLIGLGHYLDGVVINVPGGRQFGIEAACSGVVSFFTLLAVTTVFIVWARRITTPRPAIAWMLVGTGILLALIDSQIGDDLGWLALGGAALILMGIVGFRASVLLLSAVFWALFMNTVRILLIPISDVKWGFDLSHGIPHAILGYVVLIIGILLVLSTDQFLTFLFGSVEEPDSQAADFQNPITSFWNGFLWGGERAEDGRARPKQAAKSRQPVSPTGRSLIWTIAGIMILCGLWQLWDVQQSLASEDYKVRFFDADVTMDYSEDDVPEFLGEDWKKVYYESQDRSRSSDLGQRSDVWQFQSPRCQAVTSLDQTFPGWHELTTCYKNQGWNLVSRKWHEGDPVEEGGEPWAFIEARFEKNTGEKGYLLFSHFDAFGKPVEAPTHWGSLNSFFVRARNRLSNRIRATLFDGAVYQTQVFLQSYQPVTDDLKLEVRDRYKEVREIIRKKFLEKRAAEAKQAE